MPVRLRFALSALLCCIGIAHVHNPIGATTQSPYKAVDPQGYFFPLDVPRPISNITYIAFNHFEVGGPPDYEARDVALQGGVLASGKRFFKFASVKLNGLDVEFTTVTVRGTRYSFAGKFLRRGSLAEQESDQECVLKGRLTLHRGAEKQTFDVCFWYFQGD